MSDQELQRAMQSVRTSPDNPAHWRNLAALLRAKGDVTKADDCDRQVQKLLGLQMQSVIESPPDQTTQSVQQIHISPPLQDESSTVISSPPSSQVNLPALASPPTHLAQIPINPSSKSSSNRKTVWLLAILAIILSISGIAFFVLPRFGNLANKPTVPEIFKAQLMQFLGEAAKADAMASQGVNYRDFKQQIASVQASFNLLESTWPESLPSGSRDDFKKALQGWSLCLDIWEMKINKEDNPVAPNINHYRIFIDYGGDSMVQVTHPNDFIVLEYRNKKYLPFDENISVLMSLSGSHYESGKKKIIEILQ